MRTSTRSIASLSFSMMLLAGSISTLLPASQAQAFEVQPDSDQDTELQLLKDFIHFVKIARFDVAADLGEQLLDMGMDAESFVDLVEKSRELQRFEEAVAAGMRVPVLEPIAAKLDSAFHEGKLARARNPQEVARNIALLTEGLRARSLARERLIIAGEYAMPQLLNAYLQQEDLSLKAQVQRLLVDMGRHAIVPLITAMPELNGTRQEAIAEVLGLIPYRTSLPVLIDIYQSTNNAQVRQACGRAISRLGGNPSSDVAGMYSLLADSYYAQPAELTSFPGEAHQLVWNFDPGLGLVMVPIDTAVFHEAMSMRMAENSLRLNPSDRETLGLWIAANYSRALDTPMDYENPVYGADRRSAEYYGVAVGPDIDQMVLRRGLDTRDTPLVRLAIDAISQTAGSRSLWGQSLDGRYPLLESLSYQNRRVQFESALALGKAQPAESFQGSQRVIPLLASAIKDAASLHAIILSNGDREGYDQYRASLEQLGFTVLPPAENGLSDLDAAIAEIPTVDLIVTLMGYDDSLLAVESARSDNKLAVTPVLALMQPDDVVPMERQYLRDQTVSVRRAAISNDAFDRSVSTLLEVASGGPITDGEAEEYAFRAIEVLRDLAISNNQTLNISDASSILIDVLDQVESFTLLDIAEIVSYMPSQKSQQAIMNKALESSGEIQKEMLIIVGNSGKRFGNQLDNRQVRRLIELAQDSDEELATVAVATMGALEVTYTSLVPLILNTDSE